MSPLWHRIIETGILAPSGDNAQPWEFELRGEIMRVYNNPARDESVYNYSQQASRIAIGCCIENMSIAAAHKGYKLSPALFPDPNDEHAICDCELVPGAQDDTLFDSIMQRASNRKRYETGSLTAKQKEFLSSSIQQFEAIHIRFAEGAALQKAAFAASTNERVVLGNRYLHHFLFSQVRWDDEEDAADPGFFVKTLELHGPQAAVFRVLSYWAAERFLNIFGMPLLVARDNAAVYEHSAAIVAVLAPFGSPEEQVLAGRAFERLWLSATSLGLSFQPLAGISLLQQKITAGSTKQLSASDIMIIKDSYAIYEDIFSAGGASIPLLFRIGKSQPPSARTRRNPPKVRIPIYF